MDQQRFHQALFQCFQKVDQAIDYETLRDAMTGLAEQLSPKLSNEYLTAKAELYAGYGEIISSYLFDIGEFNQ